MRNGILALRVRLRAMKSGLGKRKKKRGTVERDE
jgi:hypothetical protein